MVCKRIVDQRRDGVGNVGLLRALLHVDEAGVDDNDLGIKVLKVPRKGAVRRPRARPQVDQKICRLHKHTRWSSTTLRRHDDTLALVALVFEPSRLIVKPVPGWQISECGELNARDTSDGYACVRAKSPSRSVFAQVLGGDAHVVRIVGALIANASVDRVAAHCSTANPLVATIRGHSFGEPSERPSCTHQSIGRAKSGGIGAPSTAVDCKSSEATKRSKKRVPLASLFSLTAISKP